jgi:hypothetical protein
LSLLRLLLFLTVLTIPSGAMAVSWLKFVAPRNIPKTQQSQRSPISVAVVVPEYAAVGDESSVTVTAFNRDTKPWSGTVTLRFSSDSLRPLPGGSTALDFDLKGGENKSEEVKVSVYKEADLNDPETFEVSAFVEAKTPPASPSPVFEEMPSMTKISVGPIPYLKTIILGVVSLNVLIELLVTFLFVRFRRIVLNETAKEDE